MGFSKWQIESYEQLLERLRKAGILGETEAVHYPKMFASRLVGDSVAIATCRALNNFRPLDKIIKSLWRDASEAAKRSYTLAAISAHCYSGGLFYPILEAAYPNHTLKEQIQLHCPLPLSYTEDGNFVLPLHPIIANNLLHMLSKEEPEKLLDMFCTLAKALSPYVNRRTSIAKTPEARLAARLFHAEDVARRLLGEYAGAFYINTKESWQWNSRYWEQRALFTQATDIDVAIQFARHAVAIESHPYPWTTLASLLTKKMESTSVGLNTLFEEIYDLLTQVFRDELARSWRPTPHPYSVLFHAVNVFLDKGEKLAPRKKDWVIEKIHYCARMFERDKLNLVGEQIIEKISQQK